MSRELLWNLAWQLPYFLFILFVTYRKFSKLSENMKGKSIYPFNGNDLRHKPLEKSNKVLAPFITTMASYHETRNCQQRKNVNILNRRFKAANHMPPVTSSHSNPLGPLAHSVPAWQRHPHSRHFPATGPLHLQVLLPGMLPSLMPLILLIHSLPLGLY